jgi:hypothetical protein
MTALQAAAEVGHLAVVKCLRDAIRQGFNWVACEGPLCEQRDLFLDSRIQMLQPIQYSD